LRWIVIILYIVCFGCYVLFTRQPDYFDGEFTSGTIIKTSKQTLVQYLYEGKPHHAEVHYDFLYQVGENVTVIYESSDPSKGSVYSFIGYWISFGELIASLLIVGLLYWISASVTKNPTPEAIIEEIEMGRKKPKKPKYEP
jgi:hypothetical protein